MDAVSPRPPTRNDKYISGFRTPRVVAVLEQPEATTENESIARVTRIKVQAAVHGRDAHVISVSAHSRNYSVQEIARMHDSCGETRVRKIQIAKEEHVGVCNRFGPDSQNVPDHASNPSRSPSKRLYRARMVVRFHLGRDGHRLFELYDSCV